MRKRALLLALLLSWIAIVRTEFSPEAISAPLLPEISSPISSDVARALDQPYRYLGKGRQAFVFESADQKTVIKFFNRRYFERPWYAFLFPKEQAKRDLRRQFYLQSYPIAEKYLKEETGILYVHLGKSHRLPPLSLVDKASRPFTIDLNQTPFVLQKKGTPLYPALKEIYAAQGDRGLCRAVDSFLDVIARRIAQGISDADHDVENNFGVCDGKIQHLDPGRFSLSKDFSPEHEWWSATHRFHDWLQEQYPEMIQSRDFKRALQKSGRSEGVREEMRLPSTTTDASE